MVSVTVVYRSGELCSIGVTMHTLLCITRDTFDLKFKRNYSAHVSDQNGGPDAYKESIDEHLRESIMSDRLFKLLLHNSTKSRYLAKFCKYFIISHHVVSLII